ncbi:DNA topoisomerase 1 [Coemansia erecta]|uniref:DNA topoisomerase I n=1 Tax=Coemansia erecta TaxID=147472 RepID=A0A9W7Y939_9FUNG|nr:DNA topoisomerase 1 [Coemansia erecta]
MSSSDSDDEMPLSSRVVSVKTEKNGVVPSRYADDSDSDSDDGVPLAKLKGRVYAAKPSMADSDSGSESDQPLSTNIKAARAVKMPKKEATASAAASNGNAAKAGTKRPKKEPASAQKDAKKPKVSAKDKAAGATKAKNGAKSKIAVKSESNVTATSQDDNGDSDSEEYKWWLEDKNDDGPKWSTLEHFGVMFPPEYVPHGIPMAYKGKPFKMHPAVEEVATFFAALVDTEHGNNPVFQQNFFMDFRALCNKHMGNHPIEEFKNCNFDKIRAHLDVQSAKRKAMTKEEKEVAKKERISIDEMYGFCTLDGRREKVGNFRIEPPGLFRGRGAHPKTGRLKKRVLPEQVTINIGKGAKVPDPPAGHKWGNITHDNTVTWLAMWKENINGSTKYVYLAAGSSLKGQSDMRKYEKARSLVKCIDKIRSEYTKELKSEVMAVRQRATAMYLIDRFALRAGNEKGDDEADTVGCCSLRCEHIDLEPPNIVKFDFLGKDSIRYERTTEVDKQVWKNLRLFQKEPKTPSDMLFDRLTTASLNKHLQTLMPGLTAKVFRTYNASYVFDQQLVDTPAEGTEAEKILAYNRANRMVAVLCNHQRAVSKGFEGQMSKIEDKLLAVRYQRMLLKNHLLEIAPTLKKKRPDLGKKEPGITSSWIKKHLIANCEVDREKATKKFERDNEKLKEAREPVMPKSKLKEILAEIDEREKSIKKGTYVAEPPIAKNALTEKILEKIDKLTERIANIEVNKIEKDENKSTALSTSKINYIDPRISIAWCKKHNVPLEKIFTKTLREKFTWAMDVDKEYRF